MKATNEDSRAEDDLVAQTEMARWAFYMLIATVGMAVITGAGVYYVWRTLIAIQDMARDAREIGMAQVRAYLSISSVAVSVSPIPNDLRWFIYVKLKNTGQSPAKDVEITAVIGEGFSPTDSSLLLEDLPGGSQIEETIGRGTDYSNLSFIGASRDVVAVTVSVKVAGKDVFGKPVHAKAWYAGTVKLINGEFADLKKGRNITMKFGTKK